MIVKLRHPLGSGWTDENKQTETIPLPLFFIRRGHVRKFLIPVRYEYRPESSFLYTLSVNLNSVLQICNYPKAGGIMLLNLVNLHPNSLLARQFMGLEM